MTKKQYLKKLEYCIQALPAEERNEALDYYASYLEDAENEKQVMEELGEPEDLAKSLIEKFTCVPEVKKNEKKKNKTSENENEDDEEFDYYQESLYYEFNKSEVINLAVLVGAGQFVIKSGKSFNVETRGISEKDFRCELNEAGTLIIENRKFPADRKKYGNAVRNKWCPRILITVPENGNLENLKLALSAGQLSTKGLSLTAEKTIVDLTAGELTVDGLTSNGTLIRCALGSVNLDCKLNNFTEIDCKMGNVKIDVQGKQRSYSCDAKVGMGSITFGNERFDAFKKVYADTQKKHHFAIKVGLGDVKVMFDK